MKKVDREMLTVFLPCADAGISSLNDLTKEELLWCTNKTLESHRPARFWIGHFVLQIADKRQEKKPKKGDRKGERWLELQKEYDDLVRPYFGRQIEDIPMEVLTKAAILQEEIKKAYKEWVATFA